MDNKELEMLARGILIGKGWGFNWVMNLDPSRFPDYFEVEYEGGWVAFVSTYWGERPA